MKKFFKWTGISLGSLILVLLIGLGVVYVYATAPLKQVYQIEPSILEIPEPDSLVLARGAHVAQIRECTGCHGEDLSGHVMFDEPALGTIYSANLTRGEGGIGQRYTTTDWVRAIRHGVNPDGRPLVIMPSSKYVHLGRADLTSLIAYIQQLPPVDNTHPKNSVGPMLPIVATIAHFPLISADVIDHEAPIPSDLEAGVTSEYGAYVALSCQGCHGDDYIGRDVMGTPSSNLTRLQNYTETDFITAVRKGVRPGGDSLQTEMPRWSSLTDVEVRALWTFIQMLEPAGEPTAAQVQP